MDFLPKNLIYGQHLNKENVTKLGNGGKKILKEQLVILGIAILLICVGLSGCTESNKVKAERIGEQYLSNKFIALPLAEDYGYEYNVWSSYEGNNSRYKVTVQTWAMGDKGIVERVAYKCFVDEDSWSAYDGQLIEDNYDYEPSHPPEVTEDEEGDIKDESRDAEFLPLLSESVNVSYKHMQSLKEILEIHKIIECYDITKKIFHETSDMEIEAIWFPKYDLTSSTYGIYEKYMSFKSDITGLWMTMANCGYYYNNYGAENSTTIQLFNTVKNSFEDAEEKLNKVIDGLEKKGYIKD